MAITVRELDRGRDRRAVEAIDTSFETATVFDVVTTDRRIDLVERTLDAPMRKAYSIGEVFAGWARWDTGWGAEIDGEVCGCAQLKMGVPYTNGAPNLSLETAALMELARKQGLAVTGKGAMVAGGSRRRRRDD